jgi:phage terminase large subunit-like protein
MECRITSRESSVFLPTWLNIRQGEAPRGYPAVLAIDPVPPPSERQMAKGLEGKDYEAHYVWARVGENYHLLDYARSRGHDPSWTIATAFSLMRKWRCMRMVIDAVAYQRVLKWMLEQAMQRQRVWYQVVPIADGMKKFARITGVLNGLATAGKLYIGPEHTVFAEQFEAYGPLYAGHDDDLDASALALQDLSNPFLDTLGNDGNIIEHSSIMEDNPFIARSP